jgi:hypothetical protein
MKCQGKSLILKSSQSEAIKFSRDQSESTTQIWVANLGVEQERAWEQEWGLTSNAMNFQTVLQHNAVGTQASKMSAQNNINRPFFQIL